MNGIQYVTDEKGRKVAVQIDLKKHRELLFVTMEAYSVLPILMQYRSVREGEPAGARRYAASGTSGR